ncbi:hypothetical protein AgCh_012256 [Apium graveolens]
MISHLVHFYKNLLGKRDYCDGFVGLEPFASILEVSAADDLIREVPSEEIKEVIFQMGDDKASGLNGYSALFFKKAWVVIGEDVFQAVKEFFVTGKLLKEVNATLLALNPKMDHPTVVGEFRPIALFNFIYKCITKIITNRIEVCLSGLVDDTHNAFILGRCISDNILLTQELLKNHHRKLFGFPDKMIGRIRECISSPSYSVILNGQMHGYFKGKKGFGKGTPCLLNCLPCYAVTKQVEKRIRNFIWGGKEMSKGKSKVSWKDVCCPKQEGGLGLRDLGLIKFNRVADFIIDGQVEWPEGLFSKIDRLQGMVVRSSDVQDQIQWLSKAGKVEIFFVSQRLLTQDRLRSWKISQPVVCSSYQSTPDSVDHLWFNSAVVFHIWQERNRRLFQRKNKKSWQVISDVDDDVRKKLQGLAMINSLKVR